MAEEILRNLLKQIIKELNFTDYDLKIEPVSTGGANYTSTLHNITVKENDKLIHMFGKVAAVGEKLRSKGPNIYETETFAYTKLLKVYEQLEDEHKVTQEHRLKFCKFYGCNPNSFEETIILENLIMSGYQAYDRFKTFEWDYAKSAVGDLAKMHALSYAYGEYYPEEFNKIIDETKFKWDKFNDWMSVYLESGVKRAIKIIREGNREKFELFFKSFNAHRFTDFYMWLRKPVLGHGDFRPSNLMHKTCENGNIQIKILDLQTLQGSSPIADLLYFIITGSDEEFRAKYYEKILNHYYTELSAAMTRLHLKPENVYSRDDFVYELEQKLHFGLALAVFALPIITVGVDDAPKVNKDLDFDAFSIEKTSDLYSERLNGIVNDYVKFGILK